MFTTKQKAFIEAGLLDFNALYSAFYCRYEQLGAGKTLFEMVKTVVARHFEINRIDRLLGGQAHAGGAEAGGFFRGVVALKEARRDTIHRDKEKAKEQERQEMSPRVDFLGTPEQANIFFNKVLQYLAQRFSFAIESLANHQKGISRFAKYIVYRSFLVLAQHPGEVTRRDSEQSKIDYLVRELLVYVKKEEIPDNFKNLKTEDGINPETPWSPTAVLCKSPIFFNGNVRVYVGDSPHRLLHLPFQQVQAEAEISKQNYKEEQYFSAPTLRL